MPLDLLLEDAAPLLLGTFAPQLTWGVYLNGVPVIFPAAAFSPLGALGTTISGALAVIGDVASIIGVPNIIPVAASTIEFEYSQENPISNYPQEQGAFQSYNKVNLPYDIKLRLACGGPTPVRQGFLSTCLAIVNSLAQFQIVTPEKVFTSCNPKQIDWRRSAVNGVTLIVVDLSFEEIKIISATAFGTSGIGGLGSGLNTQSPAASGQQSLGNVQPQSPATSLAAGIAPL